MAATPVEASEWAEEPRGGMNTIARGIRTGRDANMQEFVAGLFMCTTFEKQVIGPSGACVFSIT